MARRRWRRAASSKGFPGVKALQDVAHHHARRRDPRAARRERRRQIDADQDHHRRPSPGRGRTARSTAARCASPARATRSRRGIGVVHQERNLIPRFSVGENILLERLGGGLSRRRRLCRAHMRRRADGSTCSSSTSIRARRSRELNVAKRAARRDRQGAVAALARAAARRADRLADAAGDRRCCSACCASCATKARACCSSATSSKRCRKSATR